VLLKAWKMKTDVHWCCRRWMKARIQLNNARFSWKLQLPCEVQCFNSQDSAWIIHDLASTELHHACKWWLEQGTSKRNQEFRWEKLKKVWENLRWKEIGSEILNCFFQNSVMIRTLYFLLITLVKHD
jgi:hypothetical protein